MSASQRTRGANAERAVAAWLRDNGWPDARRYLAGDGKQPGDIDAIPGICIEVKDVGRSAWPSWQEQALTEAGGRIPVVVRRTRGIRSVGLWAARTPLDYYPSDHRVFCPRTGIWWAVAGFEDVIRHLTTEDSP